jgi:AAA15 family ATPase/GTPase
MLIRFIAENVYSFGKQREFNMIPAPRFTRHNHHKYKKLDFDILKMAAVYGANAAGKSNLVKAISLLVNIILNEQVPSNIYSTHFKFNKKLKPQVLAIEFIINGKSFYYAIELLNDIIKTEELYETGLGKKEDRLIFERKTDKNNKISIRFFYGFDENPEHVLLKNIVENNLSKPGKPVFKMLTSLNNKAFDEIKQALDWFENSIEIIDPNSKPVALANEISNDREFKSYAENFMCTLDTGICELYNEKKKIDEYFRGNPDIVNHIRNEIDKSASKMLVLKNNTGNEIVVIKEGNDILVESISFGHVGENENIKYFNLDEESDGTIRLLDFIPAFKEIISSPKVYIIDEIERSIHPLLIKELVKKFSEDELTRGQLIFCTHESNLLDQNIFRQDEIWFIEKDKNGASDLYSLSDFKEHNTIDIRKGYLSGRYGSIPFLGSLKDLNWHSYDS